jgi:hypothetical protein
MADKKREPSCTNNHDAFRRMLRDRCLPETPCPNCGWVLRAAREEPETLEERFAALEERVAELEERLNAH